MRCSSWLNAICIALSLGVSAGALSGCSIFFGGDQKLDNQSHHYSIRREAYPQAPWEEIRNLEAGDLAFQHSATGSMISVNSTCSVDKNFTTEAATKQLLLGLHPTAPAQRAKIELQGTIALQTTLTSATPQNPSGPLSKIQAVVLKRRDCLYDFVIVSRPDTFDADLGTFQTFLKGFHEIQ